MRSSSVMNDLTSSDRKPHPHRKLSDSCSIVSGEANAAWKSSHSSLIP